jgi:UDP-N-acetylglucosamine 2-epimerase (non-hydrolysing)
MDELRENFGIREPDVVLYHRKDITGIIHMFFWMIRILFKTIFHKQQIYRKQGANDIVLVHGDTFSTLLGALMGKVAGKKVGHVESGLRSFNLFHPFPEEITRLLTFYLTDYYFCPGDWALQNLTKFRGVKINTRYNTLLDSLELANNNINSAEVEIPDGPYAVVSLHRFENIFNKKIFRQIIDYLLEVSKTIKLLFILHPPTKEKLERYNFSKLLEEADRIELRPRYDYFNFIKLLINSDFLITDGGSNQEEAYYLGKPTILFRRTTERQEGIGENVIISDFDINIIMDFVSQYQKYARKPVLSKKSPTEIIISNLNQFKN